MHVGCKETANESTIIASLYDVRSGSCSNRSMDSLCDTARGKIRYIVGYILAKVHYQFTMHVKSTCFKTSAADKQKYDGKGKPPSYRYCEITVTTSSSSDVGSLKETERNQNLSKSLTNITEEAY